MVRPWWQVVFVLMASLAASSTSAESAPAVCHLAEASTQPLSVTVDPHGCYAERVDDVYDAAIAILDTLCIHGSEPWCPGT